MKKGKNKLRIAILGILLIAALGLLYLVYKTDSGIVNFNADTVSSSATATIKASPSSASHAVGETFTVAIVVDGGGQNFTSFGASVSATNLTIVSLAKGPVTQWLTEPNTGSLNFFGGVAGETQNVTAYTLTVKGNQSGNAAISISNGSVKATDGYTVNDIFSSKTDGAYTIGTGGGATTTTSRSATSTTSSTSSSSASSSTSTDGTTTILPVPALPVTQNELETAWSDYTESPNLSVNVDVDSSTAVFNQANDTLTGVKFYGQSPVGYLVAIYVFSTPVVQSTTSTSDGSWQIVGDDAFSSGLHTVYALATDGSTTIRTETKFQVKVNAEEKTAQRYVETVPIPTVAEKIQDSAIWKNKWFFIGIGFIVIAFIIGLIYIIILKKRRNLQAKLTEAYYNPDLTKPASATPPPAAPAPVSSPTPPPSVSQPSAPAQSAPAPDEARIEVSPIGKQEELPGQKSAEPSSPQPAEPQQPSPGTTFKGPDL